MAPTRTERISSLRALSDFPKSVRFQVPAAMIVVMTGLTYGFHHEQQTQYRQLVHEREAEAARSILLMTEAVRDDVERAWLEGIVTPASLRAIADSSGLAPDARVETILRHVPIVAAWRTAQRKAEEGGYEFRPHARGARNPEYEADEAGRRALDRFAADPELVEHVELDETSRSVRYFRPVRMTGSCLTCHGDPATSRALWGRTDGRDLLGHPMEGMRAGDLHGTFEIRRSLVAADAQMAAERDRARLLALGVVSTVALIVFVLVEVLVSGPLHRRVRAMLRAEREQDLTFRLPVARQATEIADMARAFNGFLDPVHQGLAQVVNSVGAIVTESARVADSSRHARDEAEVQSLETAQLATAMEEFSITASEVARSAAQTRELTSEASNASVEGRAVVSDVARSIDSLASEVECATVAVRELRSFAADIGMVVDVIGEVADQTGLLALNAAIEAARAGDSGRGFAVVADEVRALAQRTQESTKQIQAIVLQVQTGVDRASEVMERGHVQASQSVERSRAATIALERIGVAMEQIDGASSQIATAAHEQSIVTAEMAKNIERISGGIRAVSEGARQSSGASVTIVEQLRRLDEMVRHFRLGSAQLDFARVRSAHLAWTSRLRAHLDGHADLPADADSHRECELGRWYYGAGQRDYGDHESMRRLEEPHRRLHALVAEIRQRKIAGDRPGAERSFAEVMQLSQEIVTLLDAIEAQVSGRGTNASVELF